MYSFYLLIIMFCSLVAILAVPINVNGLIHNRVSFLLVNARLIGSKPSRRKLC